MTEPKALFITTILAIPRLSKGRRPGLGRPSRRSLYCVHTGTKVAGHDQLTLASANLLTKLLCEHTQIEPSRAESSLISPLSNSEPECGLTRVSVPRIRGGVNAELGQAPACLP